MDRTDTEAGIPLWGTVQHEMFSEYYEVEENERKAGAVRKLIRERLGKQAYSDISYAILSKDEDKGTAILQTMVAARSLRTVTGSWNICHIRRYAESLR